MTVALIGAGFCAVLYGVWFCKLPASWLGTMLKTSAVGLLALAAFWALGPGLLPLALVFAASGDFLLSRPGDKVFLAGMVAFLAAHILYIVIFLAWGSALPDAGPVWPYLVVFLVLSGGIYAALLPGLGKFRVPVAVYCMVIAIMAASAARLPFHGMSRLIILGAVAFLVSDAVLAFEKFRLPQRSMARVVTPHLIWSLYWIAQFAILLALVG